MSDLDEDGFVEWREFLENEYGDWDHEDELQLKTDGSDLVDLDYNRNYNRIRVRFETCDGNGDGKLDLDEFLLFKNPFQEKHIVDKFKQDSVKRVDLNGDGRISFDEYQRDWIKTPDRFESALRAVDDKKLQTGERSFLALVEFIRHENQ